MYSIQCSDSHVAGMGNPVPTLSRAPIPQAALPYTAFVGHRSDSIYGGHGYLASSYGVQFSSYGGLQYGADLRWHAPLKGLLVGLSRINQDITSKGAPPNPSPGGGVPISYSSVSKADWINQFYGEYIVGKLRIDSEYRRCDRCEASGCSPSLLLRE